MAFALNGVDESCACESIRAARGTQTQGLARRPRRGATDDCQSDVLRDGLRPNDDRAHREDREDRARVAEDDLLTVRWQSRTLSAALDVRSDEVVSPLSATSDSPDDISATLQAFAERLLTLTGTREAVLMHRLVFAESARFPQIGERFLEAESRRGIRLLADYFERATSAGSLSVLDPTLAAEMFVGALLGYAGRVALIPTESWYSQADCEKRARATVDLFLSSYRSDDGPSSNA